LRRTIALLIVILLLLTACTATKKLNTEQLSEFKKTVRKEYKEISDMKIQMSPTNVEFNYYLEKNTEREISEKIFLETKELVLTEEFMQSAIEETYFKHYAKEDEQFPYYPHITIRFHIDDKDEAAYQYQANYYGSGVDGVKDPDRPIDHYETWEFYEYK